MWLHKRLAVLEFFLFYDAIKLCHTAAGILLYDDIILDKTKRQHYYIGLHN